MCFSYLLLDILFGLYTEFSYVYKRTYGLETGLKEANYIYKHISRG